MFSRRLKGSLGGFEGCLVADLHVLMVVEGVERVCVLSQAFKNPPKKCANVWESVQHISAKCGVC